MNMEWNETYVCQNCGYKYIPKDHDDIPFEDLEDAWLCPDCSADKDEFEEDI